MNIGCVVKLFGGNAVPIAVKTASSRALVGCFGFMIGREPAWAVSPWYSIYFISFLVLGLFILMAVLQSVMLDVYMSQYKERVINSRVSERLALMAAYKLIEDKQSGIAFDQFHRLMVYVRSRQKLVHSRVMYETLAAGQLRIGNVPCCPLRLAHVPRAPIDTSFTIAQLVPSGRLVS